MNTDSFLPESLLRVLLTISNRNQEQNDAKAVIRNSQSLADQRSTPTGVRSTFLSLRHIAFSALGVLFCASAAGAQSTISGTVTATTAGVVTNLTSTPTPGDGHSYLADLNEIVNPANGALSIRIKVPRPHERGLNEIPTYAFMYNSGDEYQISMDQQNGTCPNPASTTQNSNLGHGPGQCVTAVSPPKFSLSALWVGATAGNGAPNTLTYQTGTYVYGVTNVQQAVCATRSGYVYVDSFGGRHPLGTIGLMQANSNGISQSPSIICSQYFGITSAPFGGDAQYKAFAADINANNPSLVSIGDSDGTALLKPEDSNGNCLSGTGRVGSYQGFLGTPGSPTCSDGASTSFVIRDSNGNPSDTGTYSLNYPGLSAPYTYTKQHTTMTYAAGYTDITPAADPLCLPANAPATFAGSTNRPLGGPAFLYAKYTSIGLPNGLSYTFTYDAVYGYINKITYPTGAWVQYTWGTQQSAEMMGWQTPGPGVNQNVEPVYQANGSNMNSFCYFRHDAPVIAKRVVSYDGVNPAQQQDFTYSTHWPSSTSQYWDSKTTVVTTTDLIRPGHPSFTTTYNYLPGVVPSAFASHTMTSGLPLEDTIVHNDALGHTISTEKKLWDAPVSYAQLVGDCEILPNGRVAGNSISI